jgi:hypothetical protein
MICGSVKTWARTTLIVRSWVLVLVATPRSDIYKLFSSTEGRAVDGTRVPLVLTKRKVRNLPLHVPHVSHGATGKGKRGRSQNDSERELHDIGFSDLGSWMDIKKV